MSHYLLLRKLVIYVLNDNGNFNNYIKLKNGK